MTRTEKENLSDYIFNFESMSNDPFFPVGAVLWSGDAHDEALYTIKTLLANGVVLREDKPEENIWESFAEAIQAGKTAVFDIRGLPGKTLREHVYNLTSPSRVTEVEVSGGKYLRLERFPKTSKILLLMRQDDFDKAGPDDVFTAIRI